MARRSTRSIIRLSPLDVFKMRYNSFVYSFFFLFFFFFFAQFTKSSFNVNLSFNFDETIAKKSKRNVTRVNYRMYKLKIHRGWLVVGTRFKTSGAFRRIFKSELILIGFVDYFIVIAFNVVVKRR